MNKQILKLAGFAEVVKDFENGICPFCKEKINLKDFEDEISLKEYHISGLCQNCQNKIFKEY